MRPFNALLRQTHPAFASAAAASVTVRYLAPPPLPEASLVYLPAEHAAPGASWLSPDVRSVRSGLA